MNAFDAFLYSLREEHSPERRGFLLARSISRWSGFPIIVIESYNPRRGKLHVIGLYGAMNYRATVTSAVETLSGIAAISGRPFFCRRFNAKTGYETVPEGVRAFWGIPIHSERGTVGVLSMLRYDTTPLSLEFKKETEALARRLGETLSLNAFDSSRAFRCNMFGPN
jgi:hypothetical protein